jgi:hypothetical protein
LTAATTPLPASYFQYPPSHPSNLFSSLLHYVCPALPQRSSRCTGIITEIASQVPSIHTSFLLKPSTQGKVCGPDVLLVLPSPFSQASLSSRKKKENIHLTYQDLTMGLFKSRDT